MRGADVIEELRASLRCSRLHLHAKIASFRAVRTLCIAESRKSPQFQVGQQKKFPLIAFVRLGSQNLCRNEFTSIEENMFVFQLYDNLTCLCVYRCHI